MRILLPVLLLGMGCIATAQPFNNFRFYTTRDGLPTNFIYQCATDNRGFLWIASDAGMVRFDGRNFVNFTTARGLPDVEVLSLVKDNNGIIWVNPFRHSVAFYDSLRSRFVSNPGNPFFAGIKGSGIQRLVLLQNGDAAYMNENGIFLIRERKKLSAKPGGTPEALISYDPGRYVLGMQSRIYLTTAEKLIDSIKIPAYESGSVKADHGMLYCVSKKRRRLDVYSHFDFSNKSYSLKSVALIGSPNQFSVTKNFICIGNMEGDIYILDKKTLTTVQVISQSLMMNSAFEDSDGQLWLCTTEKGLVKVSRDFISRLPMPDFFPNPNFISIAIDSNRNVLAGTRNGEVIVTDGRRFDVNRLPDKEYLSWQRKIITHKGHVYTFSENGSYKDYVSPLKNSLASKTAFLANDSVILVGSFFSLKRYHINTGEMEELLDKKRVTSLLATPGGKIFFSSTDGLYQWIRQDSIIPLYTRNALLANRITGMANGEKHTIWLSTASAGVIVLDSALHLLAHITQQQNLASDLGRNITTYGNTAWVSTNSGISRVTYSYDEGSFRYTITNLSNTNDLLTGTVQETVVFQDTVYAASSNGIIYFPAAAGTRKKLPSTYLTAFAVNGRDTLLSKLYSFPYDHNSVNLRFAIADITGADYSFQYQVDDDPWVSTATGDINLQLATGVHQVRIRPVDVNGLVIDHPALVEISIRPAFWQTIWFILLVAIFLFAGIFYLLHRISISKRNKHLQKMQASQQLLEMEMQAIRAQINPHFVFNCLNSIKSLNYQKRYAEADVYTDRFSSLLRHTLEYASEQLISLEAELTYIENYIQLEQLRFGEKLFYNIQVAERIDPGKITVPPLLLQPYVENAIRHGIGNLETGAGSLSIIVASAGDKLRIVMEDTGVGRSRSEIINRARNPSHRSKGLQIAARKEAFYGILSATHDLVDDSNAIVGTRVILEIPVN